MKIEYGYDKHVKAWNVVVIDKNEDIIESSYVGQEMQCKVEIEYFKSMYEIENVSKIKAY